MEKKISIEIALLGADDELQRTSQLSFKFQSPLLKVEVVRTYESCLTVIEELQGDGSDYSTTLSSELSVTALEAAFQAIFATRRELVEEPWDCAPFVAFLDGAPLPDVLGSTTVTLLKNKVKELDVTMKATLARTEDLQAKYEQLAGLVHSLLDPVQAPQGGALPALSAEADAEPSDGPAIDAMRAALSESSITDGGGRQLNTPSTSFYLSAPETTQVLSSVASPTDGTSSEAALSPLSTATTSKFNPAAPVFNPKGASDAARAVPRSADELPSSAALTAALYGPLPHEEELNRTVGDFVLALCPQQAQVAYRDSVVALLQKNFRAALNCEALEVGLHRLLCFLPDDAVKVSAVLCRNHSTKWHRIICDRLNAIAKKRLDQEAAAGSGESFPYRPAGGGAAAADEEDSCGEHVIRNVLISNTKLSIQVQCSIDSCEVELSCNSRADVCMLALLEEMAALVGKGDLFKQSLMLIRAWWCCETASYVGTSVKNYLSDLSLCVMVCAVFNVHHARIHSPLQALCAFLAEYATYDGTSQAITLQGIVPFKSTSSVQPVLPSPLNPALMGGHASAPTGDSAKSSVLLTREILEKYWLLICPPDSTNPEQQQQQQKQLLPNLSSSSEDVFGIDLRGVPNVNINLDAGLSVNAADPREPALHDEATTRVSSLEEAALAAHRQQCLRNLLKFDRSQFNIVDPFSCNNMVLERPSQNRILRLAKVFQSGAAQMAALLTQAQAAADGQIDAAALLRSFFPMSFARFVDSSARPDAFNFDASRLTPSMLAQMTRRILMTVPVEELHRQMRYCNLMVESVISRTAVLDLVVEILTQKGPLPIGEVGKALAELTCISGLSTRLKEAYGGLKKFLEDFSSVVIIGTDHPFNPHIVLRASLSPENLALNDSGVFPTHAVLRMKKVSATSLRRNAFQQAQQGHVQGAPLARPVPSPVPGVPPHQGQQGYRSGLGPMTTAGIGMTAAGRQPYPDPRLVGAVNQVPQQQQQHLHHQYGHVQPQQALQHQHQHQQQSGRLPSNLHVDTRDRDLAYRAQQQQQQAGHPALPHSQFPSQQQQLQGMGLHAPLDRHNSGSSTTHSHGTLSHNSSGNHLFEGFTSTAPSVGSGDAYDEVVGAMPAAQISPSSVNYGGKAFAPQYPGSGQQPSYHQQQQQQQQQQRPAGQQPQYDQYGFESNRSRGDSFANARSGTYPPTHSANLSSLTGHGYQAHQGFSQQQLQQQTGQYGSSPRDRFNTGSPHSGFGMDSPFFDTSSGPILSEPLALNDGPRSGGHHQRGSSFGSASGIGMSGLDGGAPGPSRSRLLSGLREGTVELDANGNAAGSVGRGGDWDLFNAPLSQDFLGGGGDWRTPQGQSERRF